MPTAKAAPGSTTTQQHPNPHSYETHQVSDQPIPPPPRPPRPQRTAGYILTAHDSITAAKWLKQEVFYTPDRTLLHCIRRHQPLFLLDAQARLLHGVFKRCPDFEQQDLTSGPVKDKQWGYAVHVTPLYTFPVPLALDDIDDVLIRKKQPQQQQPADAQQQLEQQQPDVWEPVLGSLQHGALWQEFMRQAKKHQEPMDAIQEEQQLPEGEEEEQGQKQETADAKQQEQQKGSGS